MPFLIALGIVVLLCLFYGFLILPARADKRQSAPFQNLQCAHRGFYEKDQSIPENTLRAFERAVENGYGVELDVQLTKDGKVVVFHDDTVDRETTYHGRVDSFTLQELQGMSLFNTHGDKLNIPLFTDVMAVLDGKSPTIVELKSTENYVELCEKTLAILRTCEGPYCVESFDWRIVRWFKKNAPDLMRGQLTECYAGWHKETNGFNSYVMSHLLTNFLTRPHFLAYGGTYKRPLAWRLGKLVGTFYVYWTEEPKDDHEKLQKMYDCLIFQYFHPTRTY